MYMYDGSEGGKRLHIAMRNKKIMLIRDIE